MSWQLAEKLDFEKRDFEKLDFEKLDLGYRRRYRPALERQGRPGVSTHFVIGLLLLKQIYGLSDEGAVLPDRGPPSLHHLISTQSNLAGARRSTVWICCRPPRLCLELCS